MGSRGFKDLVRLSDSQRQELLNRLDSNAQLEAAAFRKWGAEKRCSVRYEYREAGIPIGIEHPGGGLAHLLVCARNISTAGMGFLHGGYLHQGTRCKIVLPKLDGSRTTVDGRVVSSRHISGALHEIGVRFDRNINIDELLSEQDRARGDAEEFARRVAKLTGRLLYLDSDEGARLQMLQALKSTAMSPTAVSNPGAALDAVKRGRFAVVMMAVNLIEVDGVEVIGDLRRAGYRGPLVVVTDDGIEGRLAAARTAGATHILGKVWEAEDLHRLLLAVLRDVEPREKTKGTLWSKREVEEFVQQTRLVGFQIAEAVDAQRHEDALALCQCLQASASSYGFRKLAAQTEGAILALSNQSQKKAAGKVRHLAIACSKLSVSDAEITYFRESA